MSKLQALCELTESVTDALLLKRRQAVSRARRLAINRLHAAHLQATQQDVRDVLVPVFQSQVKEIVSKLKARGKDAYELWLKGDVEGHPFRGNQYTDGGGNGDTQEARRIGSEGHVTLGQLSQTERGTGWKDAVTKRLTSLGFPENKISFVPVLKNDKTSRLGGVVVGQYTPITDKIEFSTLALSSMSQKAAVGYAVHEMTHAKFARFEKSAAGKNWLTKNMPALVRDDGTTEYARGWWTQVKIIANAEEYVGGFRRELRVANANAVNESLSEMNRTGKVKGIYKKLNGLVERSYRSKSMDDAVPAVFDPKIIADEVSKKLTPSMWLLSDGSVVCFFDDEFEPVSAGQATLAKTVMPDGSMVCEVLPKHKSYDCCIKASKSKLLNVTKATDNIKKAVLPILAVRMAESMHNQLKQMGVEFRQVKRVKGDLPGHEFRGNQWTGGGGLSMAPDTGGGSGGGSEGIYKPEGWGEAKRIGGKKGKWVMADGSPLPKHTPNIPPPWTEVVINPDPKGDCLVKGRGKANKLQSLYSDKHWVMVGAAKFARVSELRSKLSSIRKEMDRDIKSGDTPTREKASVLRLIHTTGIRPGSDTETFAEKKAYGATTLEGRHVVKKGKDVYLEFVGKSGQDLSILVADRTVASDLLSRKASSGKRGRIFDTDSTELLAYSKERDGGGFKSKDFRTAVGTNAAVEVIKDMRKTVKTPKTEKEYKALNKEVAIKVAKVLGNTWKVALKNYIDPAVFSIWRVS